MPKGSLGALTFNDLLAKAGYDPARVLLMRHTPIEPELQKVLPWLVEERPELFETYQRIQWKNAETAMGRASHVAAFLALESKEAVFVGLYRLGEAKPIDYSGYWAVPGQHELVEHGMAGRQPGDPDQLLFEIERTAFVTEWIGRLTVDWPAMRTWFRWSNAADPAVRFITRDSQFVRTMPPWEELVLSWAQLKALPTAWKDKLAQWRGIYLIFDSASRAGYVGSAGGSENLLGRWLQYAASGHGGNKNLLDIDPANLQFSILQRTSPDLPIDDLRQIETGWKKRLHTREFGLNAN